MKKVYVITNDKGYLLKTKTPKGKPKFLEVKRMDKVWITDDKVAAEDMCYKLKQKGYINKYRFTDGVIEIPNDDGMYDEFLKA